MPASPTIPKTVTELLAYLFEEVRSPLARAVAAWLVASPRFLAFAEANRSKIRKKIRGVRDAEGARDLHLELEVAYRLLQERRLEVAYEPMGTGKTRAPDFTVTFRTRLTFSVEVTRQRATLPPSDAPSDEVPALHQALIEREEGRLTDTVCHKLGQLLPSMGNVLLIAAEGEAAQELDVERVMTQLRLRAERRDETLLARHGFEGTGEFFKQYQRFSALLVRGGPAEAPVRSHWWLNRQAKHPLPPDLRTALVKLL